jgi:hypothetical protein
VLAHPLGGGCGVSGGHGLQRKPRQLARIQRTGQRLADGAQAGDTQALWLREMLGHVEWFLAVQGCRLTVPATQPRHPGG